MTNHFEWPLHVREISVVHDFSLWRTICTYNEHIYDTLTHTHLWSPVHVKRQKGLTSDCLHTLVLLHSCALLTSGQLRHCTMYRWKQNWTAWWEFQAHCNILPKQVMQITSTFTFVNHGYNYSAQRIIFL